MAAIGAPAAVPAAAVPAVAAPAAGGADPATYLDEYNARSDPFNGDYTGFLAAFRPPPVGGPAGPAPAQLFGHLMSNTSQVPSVYAFVTNAPSYGVSFMHRPSAFGSTPGLPTPHDGQHYGFRNDVVPGSAHALISVSQWPDTAFEVTAEVLVPNLDQMTELWANAAGADCVGPFNPFDPNVRALRSRRMFPVPRPYWGTCFSRGHMSMEEFWTLVGSDIINQNRAVEMAPFLDWICVQSTHRLPLAAAAPGGGPRLPEAVYDLPVPILQGPLQSKVAEWIERDLPGRRRATGALADLAAAQQGTLQVLQTSLTRQQQDAVAARQPKTMDEKFPELALLLRRQLELAPGSAFPTFWNRFPNLKEGDIAFTLTSLFGTRATDLNTSPPIATPDLVKAVRFVQFGYDSDDSLSKGLSIFQIVTGISSGASDAQRRRDLFILLNTGTHSPAVETAQACYSEDFTVPSSSFEQGHVVGGHAVVLDVLLGPQHRLSVAHRQQVFEPWKDIGRELEVNYGGEGRAPLLRTAFVRMNVFIWRECNRFFREVMAHGANAQAPSFRRLLESLQHSNFDYLTQLPPHMFKPLGKDPLWASPVIVPQGDGTYALVNPGDIRTVTTSSVVTDLSSITSEGVGTEPRTKRTSVEVENPNDKDMATKWKATGRSLCGTNGVFYDQAAPDKRRKVKADDGRQDLCLAYVLRGKCFQSCGHNKPGGTHRKLTGTERKRVAEAAGVTLE